jgi:two-component system chemotaxis response regulator CheY
MPTMDGEQMMEQLAADQLLGTIPVIVISTDRSEARLHRMLNLGARDYVTKPFLPETLGQVMDRVLMGEVHAND